MGTLKKLPWLNFEIETPETVHFEDKSTDYEQRGLQWVVLFI